MRLRTATIYAAFLLSGAAALIYQSLWIRLFGLFFGTSVHAMSVVVATFMAGLALGSAVFGRIADRTERPLRLYAKVEAAVSVLAFAVVLGVPQLGPAVRWLGGGQESGDAALAARFALAAAVLLIPCALIGGTLPIMVRFIVRDIPSLGERIGLLYYVNTLGAALGVFVQGLWLVELLGIRQTALVAAGMNLVIAGAAWLLDRSSASSAATVVAEQPSAEQPEVLKSSRGTIAAAAFAFFVSGLIGIGLEIAWYRALLGFLHNGAVVVTALLGLLLIGLALGGLLISRIIGRLERPNSITALVFLLLGTTTVYGLGNLELTWVMRSPADTAMSLHIGPIVAVLFPSAVLMGVLFPLLTRILVTDPKRIGTQLGSFYALNTVGCVVGGLATPFVLLPWLGTSATVIAYSGLAATAGLLLLILDVRQRGLSVRLHAVSLLVAIGLVWLGWQNRDVYREAYLALAMAQYPRFSKQVVFKEGTDSTVSLYATERPNQGNAQIARYRIQVNASPMVAFDTNETKIMAHLPLMAVANPKRALVICFGMGNTFRSALAHDIDVDVVDINGSIPPLARFHQDNPAATFDNPRGKIVINDGRNHLLMTQHQYDMISVDPAPPIWGVGMVNLHTQEFFELARDRLTDDGVMLMWALSNDKNDFLGMLAAFRNAFPHVAVFRGAYYEAYHLLGSKKPIRIEPSRAEAVFAMEKVRADVNEIVTGQLTAKQILSLEVAREAEVDLAIKGIEPLTDNNPTMEYRFIRGFTSQPFRFPRMQAATPTPPN